MKPIAAPDDRVPAPARANVQAIVKLEEEQDQLATPTERILTRFGGWIGSVLFVLVQGVAVAIWIGLNVGLAPGIPPFDPPAFPILAVGLSFESVLLTALVLTHQNRMSRKAEHRSHLDLQINLLSEQAVTKVIQMLERISREMGIEHAVVDAEAEEFAKDTPITEVSPVLRTNLNEKASEGPL